MDTTKIEALFPEERSDGHLFLLDNSLMQQYQLTVERSSNVTSNIILKNVFSRNSELLTADLNNRNVIHNTALSLLPNSELSLSRIKEWDTCLENGYSLSQIVSSSLDNCKCVLNKEHFDLKQYDCSQANLGNARNSIKTESSVGSSKDQVRPSEEQKQQATPFVPTQCMGGKTVQMGPVPKTIDSVQETGSEKEENGKIVKISFKTANELFLTSNPSLKRSLGATRKAQGKFVSPMAGVQEKKQNTEPEVSDERLKHIDPKMIELIESEIIDRGSPLGWDDIAGLELAKSVIQEAVVWPLLRPDIFTGLRQPPKGILLFGPPGTGKTLIGKCIARQCNATFFSISASSLTSKWLGDAEKMVRALFAVARTHQPAVIFIDEIDSLLSQRCDSEHDATRRIKTEFLVQFDGAATREEDRVLLIGATNRPQELDEAARRRFVKRLYIPLPDVEARKQLISNLLKTEMNRLSASDITDIATETQGYSGADMKSLCSEAAMGPIRSLPLSQIATIDKNMVRPVCAQDFIDALKRVKSSVSQEDLGQYVKWNETFGQES